MTDAPASPTGRSTRLLPRDVPDSPPRLLKTGGQLFQAIGSMGTAVCMALGAFVPATAPAVLLLAGTAMRRRHGSQLGSIADVKLDTFGRPPQLVDALMDYLARWKELVGAERAEVVRAVLTCLDESACDQLTTDFVSKGALDLVLANPKLIKEVGPDMVFAFRQALRTAD